MATITAKVFRHHIKNDGTLNIKFKLYHSNALCYIPSSFYVSYQQVLPNPERKTEFIVKNIDIMHQIEKSLDEYRLIIGMLGNRLKYLSCIQLKEYLEGMGQHLDFVDFGKDFIKSLEDNGKFKNASNYRTVIYSLIDFFGKPKISFEEIDTNRLILWERYLRTERTISRFNQNGRLITSKVKPLQNRSIHNYLRNLRALFNHAKRKYNNRGIGYSEIKHDPFKDYPKIIVPQTEKRHLDVSTVPVIRDTICRKDRRAALARDLFMLSFYLCGINAVDLYKVNSSNLINGRLEYNRSKTRERRIDGAFISVKIVEPAVEILSKHIGKLSKRYATVDGLNKALGFGMKKICKINSLRGITFYSARHTVGNLARNKCRCSKDDVALALNHVDLGRKITDIYLDKDWSIMDELQEKVISLLNDENKMHI